MRIVKALVAACFMLLPATSLGAGEKVGTLTLDGLSFLSFENLESLAIPSGSTIRFHFETPSNGVASFMIEPSGVAIAPIPLADGKGELSYTLASPASGTIRASDGGYVISFSAAVQATVNHPTKPGARTHHLSFTTEHAQATSLNTGQVVAVDGVKAIPGPRYVQIVGAVANPAQSYPRAGAAVYTVLSGTFDWLPGLN